MDVRWTGRQGEKAFSLLCSRRSVTCNKAEEDDLGWDYILNLPPPTLLHLPIDQRSSGIAAIVQIKATRIDAQRWTISLKNALSLAKSPLPAFIICVGIDADGRETYRAVHIWQEHLARILKAARQAHVEGDEATNHRTVSFRFGEDTFRPDVIDWMREEIELVGPTRYAAAKQMLVDTLGFEDGHGIARMRFGTASPTILADLQLGLIDGADLDHFSFTPSRFGIEATRPDVEVEGARLEIIPNGRNGTLRLRASDGQQVFMPAQVYTASQPGRRRTKMRIAAGFIDVLIATDCRIRVTCREHRDHVTTIDHIAGLALLRRSTRKSKLTMSFRTDRSWNDMGHVNGKGIFDRSWEQLLFVTQSLRTIAEFEQADPVATTVNAINDRFVPLSVLDALVSKRSLRIEFTPEDEREGEVSTLLAHASVRFGTSEVGAVASRPVTADVMIGTRRRIDFGPATLLHCATDVGRVGLLPELYLDELDRLSELGDVLAIGDLQRSVHSGEDRELLVDSPRRTPMRLLRPVK